MKIPFAVISDIVRRLVDDAEADFSESTANSTNDFASMDGRVLLVDGFTIRAADTVKNQRKFPQNPVQKMESVSPFYDALRSFRWRPVC